MFPKVVVQVANASAATSLDALSGGHNQTYPDNSSRSNT